MPNYPVSPPPANNRDLRRDRSILALAAALCGALGAAGLAALAVSAQLSTEHHDRTIADATVALSSATELLERTRGELEAEREALRAARDESEPGCDGYPQEGERTARHRHGEHRKHRKHHKHREDRRHRSRDEGVATAHGSSTIATTATTVDDDTSQRDRSADVLSIFTMLRPTGISCASEHHCQIDSAVNGAAEPLPTESPLRARYVPSIRDGERLGTKIYGIRSGSPMKLLGFRNGDLIRSTRLTGTPQLDSNSDQPRHATIAIELERKGETLRKIIDVL